MLKNVLLRALLLLALLIPVAPALAAQGSGCLPTTGTVSGLTLVQDINAAVAALISSNSGSSAPATDCTATGIKGQLWLDTSTTPATVRIYDGTAANWLAIGTVDAVGHTWVANSTALKLFGTSSGIVTVQGQAAAGTYNLNLPTSAGTSGQPLLSGGGGSSSMTFGTLGVAAGGTGATTSTGTGSVVLSGSPALTGTPTAPTAALGASTTQIATTAFVTTGIAANISPAGDAVLTRASSTVVTLLPTNGNLVSFPSGVAATIGSAGVSATASNCYVNGTSGQTLSANTLYYVYLWVNSGAPTLDFSTTGHSTDTASGIEIKTGDATRVLVGMVYPAAGPVFVDNATTRTVASWFNRRPKVMSSSFSTARSTSSSTFVEVNSEIRCNFLSWGDALQASFSGYATNGGGQIAGGVSLNAATTGFASTTAQTVSTGTGVNMSISSEIAPSEGFGYVTYMGAALTNTTTWQVSNGAGVLSGVVVQ